MATHILTFALLLTGAVLCAHSATLGRLSQQETELFVPDRKPQRQPRPTEPVLDFSSTQSASNSQDTPGRGQQLMPFQPAVFPVAPTPIYPIQQPFMLPTSTNLPITFFPPTMPSTTNTGTTNGQPNVMFINGQPFPVVQPNSGFQNIPNTNINTGMPDTNSIYFPNTNIAYPNTDVMFPNGIPSTSGVYPNGFPNTNVLYQNTGNPTNGVLYPTIGIPETSTNTNSGYPNSNTGNPNTIYIPNTNTGQPNTNLMFANTNNIYFPNTNSNTETGTYNSGTSSQG